MCLALSVPWVLYHSFCSALNKQVFLLELQLYKLKIYALTVCILSMCSRLRLTAFFWYAAECVFVQSTSFTVRLSFNHKSADQLALFLRICIMVESNLQVVCLSVTLIFQVALICDQDYRLSGRQAEEIISFDSYN